MSALRVVPPPLQRADEHFLDANALLQDIIARRALLAARGAQQNAGLYRLALTDCSELEEVRAMIAAGLNALETGQRTAREEVG